MTTVCDMELGVDYEGWAWCFIPVYVKKIDSCICWGPRIKFLSKYLTLIDFRLFEFHELVTRKFGLPRLPDRYILRITKKVTK